MYSSRLDFLTEISMNGCQQGKNVFDRVAVTYLWGTWTAVHAKAKEEAWRWKKIKPASESDR